MNKTYIKTQRKKHKWYLIDAKNRNLGRLSTRIAILLKGKKSPEYVPYINSNIHIIIINSQFINITGKKKYQKMYKKHSGRPGGLTVETFTTLNQRMPNKVVEHSVKGMLPKNALGRQLFRQLKVYSNDIHPHRAQKPETITLY
uniref:Large ribosomal subunit protein uL13c n=1 Tax=Caulacanthus okamurae TaxID=152008 RepID=A0A6H1U6Y1_9FLOR|nr:50S ribosomal protein L13 [Caulacanthus okamurae]QIZ74642.1 50S ribosomal protein L13 [Caulacanthus okamurae]